MTDAVRAALVDIIEHARARGHHDVADELAALIEHYADDLAAD